MTTQEKAAETRRVNKERREKAREERARQTNEFCEVLLQLMKSEECTDRQKAQFATTYAKLKNLV